MTFTSRVLSLAVVAGLGLTGLAGCAGKPTLSDGQIVNVVSTANTGEQELARLALEKATNPKVKEFAQMMLDDHTTLDSDAKGLAGRENLAPVPSDASAALEKDVKSKLEDLSKKTGDDFDKAYIDANIDAHKKVITAVDDVLIPQAKDAALKQMLMEARPKLVGHRDHAEALRKSL